MATINFPGLSTGIDTSTIITQIINADSNIKNMYSDRVKNYQSKQESLVTFKSDLKALQTAASNLSNADDLKSFNVATSDDAIVTADATSNAGEGTHSIVVKQLATSDRWVQSTGTKYQEDRVGAGTFIYSYGGLETTITTTTTTTLSDLVGLINNDANNPGVTASLLSYNNQYHLVLSGKDAGTDNSIFVNSSSTETWETGSELTVDGSNADTTTLLTKLDQFTGSTTFTGAETLELGGLDGDGNPIGTDHNDNPIKAVTLHLTSNTKVSHVLDAINEAYDGNVKAVLKNGKIIVTDAFSGKSEFTVKLIYNANGSSANLDIPTLAEASVGGATEASLTGFAASDFTRSQVAQDSKITVDGFPAATAVPEVQQITHSTEVTGGTFTLSYGGYTTKELDYNASIDGIDGIQAALDALPSVQPGDIKVSGKSFGDGTGNLTFTYADTLGDVSGMLIDASKLSDTTLAVTEDTKGVDAYISRSSNTISDVVDGITFYLHGVTGQSTSDTATSQQITLTRNTDTLTTKLNALVTAYNTVATFIAANTGYDTSSKTAGVLMGDYTVNTVENHLYTSLVNNAKGFLSTIDKYISPSQLGLSVDSSGQLSLDTNMLNTAISDNYLGVLALLGATKTGTSNSNTIGFYSASSNYTTAGEYNVRVTVLDGVIKSAQIKMSDESDSAWRSMTISGNTITGNSTFDSSNGYPVYDENGLQLTVDLSRNSGVLPFTATIDVKQGFAGALNDALNAATKDTTGSIYIDNASIQDEIDSLNDRISEETTRLAAEKTRLTTQYANLEATLTQLKSQLSEITGSTS
jgi:flagellar hook-associated protein 2